MQLAVLDFWFKEAEPAQWWQTDAEFDALIARKFTRLLIQAAAGELYAWRDTAQGRLAEIIVLDQFSRNVYRNSPKAFAQDSMALALSQEAVRAGVLAELGSEAERGFLLMPYMHSESKLIHELAVPLFKEHASANNYEFELKHKMIVDRFGRYPHRNETLGRESSVEEIEFLKQPGSSF